MIRLRSLLPCFIVLLAACAGPSTAPVVERAPVATPGARPPVARQVPVAPPSSAERYVVQRGDTLYSIALDHGVDYRDVARWNAISEPSRIRVGQVLRLRGDAEAPAALARAAERPGVEVGSARSVVGGVQEKPLEAAIPPGGPGDGRTKTGPKALRLPYTPENVALLRRSTDVPAPAAPASPAPAATPAAPTPAQPVASAAPSGAADPDAIEFVWPARGKVLAGFSEPKQKGLDIDGQPGDAVVAAAPGRVLYTGTGIRGFGKLIVIKHDNGFSSVYGHNREILVKEGQTVARGERIAELGATDSDRPKLHFEIRKSGKPVDPMRYLQADRPS